MACMGGRDGGEENEEEDPFEKEMEEELERRMKKAEEDGGLQNTAAAEDPGERERNN